MHAPGLVKFTTSPVSEPVIYQTNMPALSLGLLTKGTHRNICDMKLFDWSDENNTSLLSERKVSFEEVVFWIMHGGLLDILEHPNKERYPNQRIFVVNIDDYAYMVPSLENDDRIFLKTIIPSRKMTQKCLRAESS